MQPLYSVAQIRAMEQSAATRLPIGALMQRAGHAAATLALQLLSGKDAPRALILAGPGNNGGDALEVAAHLAQAHVDVSILHLAGGDPAPETIQAQARAMASTAQWISTLPAAARWDLVVDGLFGIGLARPLEGLARSAAQAVSEMSCPVLALDVPSGLNADTGAVVGPEGVAVRASHTITFIGFKPGLYTGAGRDYAGEVTLASLEVAPGTSDLFLNDSTLFGAQLKARAHQSHKGSYGNVAVVGGAAGMTGAPVLAARAALYGGAGRVYIASIAPGLIMDSQQPELMCRSAEEFALDSAILVAGPGMGNADASAALLARVLASPSPLVLDADALNLIADSAELQARLAARPTPAILTPHPLEAARLLGYATAVVQADRVLAARTLAQRLHAIVVLKGSGTVIAAPDGLAVINTTGNAGLATAGSGDVLAGLCGALVAQAWPAWHAALGAVWIHGMAADYLVNEGIGPIGLTASEIPVAARAVLNELVDAHQIRRGPPQS